MKYENIDEGWSFLLVYAVFLLFGTISQPNLSQEPSIEIRLVKLFNKRQSRL